jgi:hypothetical protein
MLEPAAGVRFAYRGQRKDTNMDKMIVTICASEKEAYEGGRALKEMHDEGSIVLYAMAIIAKEPNGKMAVKQAADQGPGGTVLGMATDRPGKAAVVAEVKADYDARSSKRSRVWRLTKKGLKG